MKPLILSLLFPFFLLQADAGERRGWFRQPGTQGAAKTLIEQQLELGKKLTATADSAREVEKIKATPVEGTDHEQENRLLRSYDQLSAQALGKYLKNAEELAMIHRPLVLAAFEEAMAQHHKDERGTTKLLALAQRHYEAKSLKLELTAGSVKQDFATLFYDH